MNNSKDIMNIVFFNLSNEGLRVRSASKIYVSKPMPSGLGPTFYNRVILINSELKPNYILKRLKKIEKIYSKRSFF